MCLSQKPQLFSVKEQIPHLRWIRLTRNSKSLWMRDQKSPNKQSPRARRSKRSPSCIIWRTIALSLTLRNLQWSPQLKSSFKIWASTSLSSLQPMPSTTINLLLYRRHRSTRSTSIVSLTQSASQVLLPPTSTRKKPFISQYRLSILASWPTWMTLAQKSLLTPISKAIKTTF